MSRKRKGKHNARTGCDKHHILFYRSEWNRGCCLLLRRAFVFEIPVETHKALHAELPPVPPLTDYEARQLWHSYREFNLEMSLFEAYRWLIKYSPNDEFKEAISNQYEFMKMNLPKNWGSPS